MPSISRQLRGWGRQNPPAGAAVDRTYPAARQIASAWPLNEGGGAPRDVTSRKNVGTLVGGPTWAAGPFGGPALNFVAASSQYVTLPTAPIFNNNAVGSVSAWFRTTSTVAGTGIVYGEGNNPSTAQLAWLYVNSPTVGNMRFVVRDNASTISEAASTGLSINDGRWHHAAGVSTGVGGTVNLYIDGNLITSVSNVSTATMTLNTAIIGATLRATAAGLFDGQIAVVKLWPRPLSSAEIMDDRSNPFGFIRSTPPIRIRARQDIVFRKPVGGAAGRRSGVGSSGGL